MDFIKEFQRRISVIDAQEIPKPRYDFTELWEVIKPPLKPPTMPKIRRYNIHKRSLPEGVDTVVVFNVTKLEADWMIQTKLKTKIENIKDQELMIYYDVVPTDASKQELSIYHNKRPITKEGTEHERDDSGQPLLGSDSQWID